MQINAHGGFWTEEKLRIVKEYLEAYTTALRKQMGFKLMYIDAFAGSGMTKLKDGRSIPGSALNALEIAHPFDSYVFIEKDQDKVDTLRTLIKTRGLDDCSSEFMVEDVNTGIPRLMASTDWNIFRAVAFVDPCATQTDWTTIETIAQTKRVDVWYLFPLSAVTRELPRGGRPDPTWVDNLNRVFGDDQWLGRFYIPNPQMNLLDIEDDEIRNVNQIELKNYILERLRTVFHFVSDRPRILYNSNNSPLFMLCFAMGNGDEKAIRLGRTLADYILGRSGI